MNQEIAAANQLFAFRSLPVSHEGEECFYCAMTGHSPANCPSKLLAMASRGINELGFLPFSELSAAYQAVFPIRPQLIAQLKEGVKTADLRKNRELLVFVSYMDIFAVFQPRFLWNFAFSGYSKWDAYYRSDKIRVNNQNLHIALDCLRVKQYEKAEALLKKEAKRDEGNRFAACVGLAFWSLEQNWMPDVGRYLEHALDSSMKTSEVIYANLLLSRFHELRGHFWDARKTVGNALKADYDCHDTQYRRIQLAVREGLSEVESKQLGILTAGNQEMFFRALLDPLLIPIQAFVDDVLSRQYEELKQQARACMPKAREEFEALLPWLNEKDGKLRENQNSLAQLEQQMQRESYNDVLEVAERGKGIFMICTRERRQKTESLRKKIKQQGAILESYLAYWNDFRYQNFFKGVQSLLSEANKKNHHAITLLNDNKAESIRQALLMAGNLDTDLLKLKKDYDRLRGFETMIRGGCLFGKKLMLCEAVMTVVLVLLFPVTAAVVPDIEALSFLTSLANNHAIRRNAFLFSLMALAPFLAFVWTIVNIQNE